MITREQKRAIHTLYKNGFPKAIIARLLSISINSVVKYLTSF